MGYSPKSANDILRDLRGMMLGRTDLNDIFAGSVINTLLSSVAQEIASSERRLYGIREAFYLRNASGQDLDERVAELPPVGISRIEATNASGAVLTIARATSLNALTIPAGSTVKTTAGAQYRTTQDVVITAGNLLVENVHIVAIVAGSQGNALSEEISTIVSMPDDVIDVYNTQPVTNGTDRESDEDLRERALLYLQSLTRCTRSALEFLGTSFIASTGERMRFARLFEDPETPAYSELIVDDGSGLTVGAVSRVAATTSGVIPSNGSSILYHQAPATEPLTSSNLSVTRSGVAVSIPNSAITSIPERGILYVDEGTLQAGDIWEIRNYRTFEGLIKELQAEIEGDVDNPSLLTGFRAAGTRCVVKLADAQFINLDMTLSVDFDVDFNVIERTVRETLVNFINGLAPSEPLYVSALIEAARGVTGVRDIQLYQRGTANPLDNQYPASPRVAIRVNSTSINISNNEAS
jgi:uncharacterized phage protein gp47/JayE